MPTPPPSNSRKPRPSDQCPLEGEAEAFQTVLKKREAVHTPDTSPPATHQDHPSPIRLSRGALKALKRQNTRPAREPRANQQPRRPATRLAVAEWQRRHPPLKPAPTYLENCGHGQYRALQSFAGHGGPDLRDLIGCQRAALRVSMNPMAPGQASAASQSRDPPSSRTKPTTEGGTSKARSTYNRAFQQALIDSSVYPPHYRHSDGRAAPKPKNWDDLNERLAQRRASLSPSKFSQEQHDRFVDLDASAAKEGQVKTNVIPIIAGTIKDPRAASGEIPFRNLDPLENLASSTPDFFRGARAEDLDRQVREDLMHTIVPSTQYDSPILPNHFLAVKGPDGTAAVAVRQATYDAFFGARAMQAIHNYGRAEPQFDNNAYTFSSIYSHGQLRIFTSHPVKPNTPGGRPSYYMNQVRSFSMIDTPEIFRIGATFFRNSLDLAEEFRNDAICGANAVVADRARVTPFASNDPRASFVSTGSQLELDQLRMESQAPTTPKVSSEDFQPAASSQGEEEGEEEEGEEEEEEEEEVGPSLRVPAKRSSRFRRQTDSRKRRNREDSEDPEGTGSTPLSSQDVVPQASSSAAKKGRGKTPVR